MREGNARQIPTNLRRCFDRRKTWYRDWACSWIDEFHLPSAFCLTGNRERDIWTETREMWCPKMRDPDLEGLYFGFDRRIDTFAHLPSVAPANPSTRRIPFVWCIFPFPIEEFRRRFRRAESWVWRLWYETRLLPKAPKWRRFRGFRRSKKKRK